MYLCGTTINIHHLLAVRTLKDFIYVFLSNILGLWTSKNMPSLTRLLFFGALKKKKLAATELTI